VSGANLREQASEMAGVPTETRSRGAAKLSSPPITAKPPDLVPSPNPPKVSPPPDENYIAPALHSIPASSATESQGCQSRSNAKRRKRTEVIKSSTHDAEPRHS
jgi:hypothetical protein